MWGSLLLVQRESYDIMGIMRQQRFLRRRALKWQSACHTPQPASQPSFTWWHTENHSDAAGTRDWRLCVYVCVQMLTNPSPPRSDLIVRMNIYIYYIASLGGGGVHWVAWPWSWHTFSHTLSLGQDVLHKRPAAHTGHDFYYVFSVVIFEHVLNVPHALVLSWGDLSQALDV